MDTTITIEQVEALASRLEADETTTAGPVETYKQARAEGLDRSDAAYRVMDVHGISAADAGDLVWRIETGRPAPEWLDSYGGQTQAARDHERGTDNTGR